MVTSAPALREQSRGALPTGPVPAVTTIFFPSTSPSACVILTTAATAVVFEPLESSIIETRNGPKNASCAAASSCSPAAMSVPPMKIGGVVQVLGAAREDAAVHEIANVAFGDAAVAHDGVGAGVVRDDLVEDARQARAVELEQEFAHVARTAS